MSAQPVAPPRVQRRLRALVIGLAVTFLLGFFLLRVLGEDDLTEEAPEPLAGAGTTTTEAGPEAPGTTGPVEDDPATTTSTTAATDDEEPALPPLQGVRLELVYDGLSQPTVLTAPPGDDRLFVVRRGGVVRILDENRELVEPAFLDLTDRVLAGGIEQGLLGMAFHPDYAENGRFFVYYTDQGGRRQLSEFSVSDTDPDRADPDSERVLIELEQPPDATDIRHYGGNLQFGPDGYLWLSMGDGADSRAQGQDPETMFGTVSRIDVDSGDPYGIPPENPFVDGGGAPEVWAYGLRNPWRFSIDHEERMVYIADVGHADQEEINVVPLDEGGFNFGWSDMEGTRCFHAQDCDPDDYTSPALTYTHEEGISVTGGHVYRGEEIPELDGTYFYSDWISAFVRSFRFEGGQVTAEEDWTEGLGVELSEINSYGLDGHGELYLLTHGGQVYRFTAER